MRILFVTTEYPPEVYWGGIATYTHAMAHALAERAHEVHVVAKTRGEARDESDASVRVHWVPERRPAWLRPARHLALSSEWIVHFGRNLARRTRDLQRQYGEFDVVEAPETQAAGFWLRGPCRSRFVTVLHNPGYKTREFAAVPGNCVDHRIRDCLERRQTIRSAAIVSPSAIMADTIARDWRIPRERITVIPHPAPPLPAKEDMRPYERQFAGRDYMLFFGRLQTLKGVHVIGQALPEVLKAFPNLHMAFIARDMPYRGGPMKGYVRECCKGLDSRLIFIEKLPKEQLVPVIRGARLCVLPSLWENFSLAVLESLGLGKLTIASKRTGAEEIIEDGISGFLAEPGSVPSLRETLLHALMLPDAAVEEMRKAALRRSQAFSIEKILPLKLASYREIGGSERRPAREACPPRPDNPPRDRRQALQWRSDRE